MNIKCIAMTLMITTIWSQCAFGQATPDEKRRLNYQNRLDDFGLLTDASFASTHNSYHSSGDGYGGLVNQSASRAEQLEAGIQFINYDIRLWSNIDGSSHAGMCHGDCYPGHDRLTEGLDDIELDLLANPNKVIFLMLEVELNDLQRDQVYSLVAGDLRDHPVGRYLYKPSHFSSSYANSNTCRILPLNQISEAQIKSQVGAENGSALVVSIWHKDEASTPCPTNNQSLWNYSWGFKYSSASNDRGGDFWELEAENRGVGDVFYNQYSASEITTLMEQMGANIVALDHIVNESEGGDRFHSLIWSWGEDQPIIGSDNTKGCVVAGASGWRTVNCAERYRAVCQKIDSQLTNSTMPNSWRLTNQAVDVTSAQTACQSLGANYHFAAPINPEQAYQLKNRTQGENVLINVRMDAEYSNENGTPYYSVRVAGSHNPNDPARLLTSYQNNTLLQEVDNLHAAYDQAFVEFEGAYDAMIAADAEYDAASAALSDCQDRRAIDTSLCPWAEYEAAYDRYNDAYYASLEASDFYFGGALAQLNAARQSWASKRTEYQSQIPQPPSEQIVLSDDVLAGQVVVPAGSRSEWLAVAFDTPFSVAPVVLASPLPADGSEPGFAVVRNVTRQGFELQIKEWDYLDGLHGAATIDFLAVTPGSHTLGGMKFVAQPITVDEVFKTLTFSSSFNTTPAVFSQLQMGNQVYQSAVPRLRSVSSNGVQVRLQEQEFHDGDHWYERVNIIAVSQGEINLNGKKLKVGKTIANHNHKAVNFGGDFVAPLFFSSIETFNGGDTATVRRMNLTESQATVKVEEEKSSDPEVGHVNETLSWMVFER